MSFKTIIKLIIACCCVLTFRAFAIEVAVTIDGFPAHAPLPPGVTRLDVVNQFIKTFKKHHIKGVYGMMVGNLLEQEPRDKQVLTRWLDSGHYLGNHSYSHMDLARTSAADYIADIQRTDDILARIAKGTDYKYFRYPYSSEGETLEKRDAVLKYLADHSYKLADVTIDFSDYLWDEVYPLCATTHNEKAIAWLKKSYIEQALNALVIAHTLSQEIFQRDVKNILLIHLGAFDAIMLDDLLTAYEKKGVKFISLSEAFKDPIYSIKSNLVRSVSFPTYLSKMRLTKGLPNPPLVAQLQKQRPVQQLNALAKQCASQKFTP